MPQESLMITVPTGLYSRVKKLMDLTPGQTNLPAAIMDFACIGVALVGLLQEPGVQLIRRSQVEDRTREEILEISEPWINAVLSSFQVEAQEPETP